MVADVEDFDVETDLPRFLNSVLEKAEYICHGNVESRIVEHLLLSIRRSGLVTLQNQRYKNSKPPVAKSSKCYHTVDLTCSRIYLFLFICSLKCVLSGPPRLAPLSAEPGD